MSSGCITPSSPSSPADIKSVLSAAEQQLERTGVALAASKAEIEKMADGALKDDALAEYESQLGQWKMKQVEAAALARLQASSSGDTLTLTTTLTLTLFRPPPRGTPSPLPPGTSPASISPPWRTRWSWWHRK